MIVCTCTYCDTISRGANGAIFKVASPPRHARKMWICLLAWVHLFFRVNNTINFWTTGATPLRRTGRGAACWLWNQCEGFYMDQASWREGPLRNDCTPARGMACFCRDFFFKFLLSSSPVSHRLSKDTFITNRYVNDLHFEGPWEGSVHAHVCRLERERWVIMHFCNKVSDSCPGCLFVWLSGSYWTCVYEVYIFVLQLGFSPFFGPVVLWVILISTCSKNRWSWKATAVPRVHSKNITATRCCVSILCNKTGCAAGAGDVLRRLNRGGSRAEEGLISWSGRRMQRGWMEGPQRGFLGQSIHSAFRLCGTRGLLERRATRNISKAAEKPLDVSGSREGRSGVAWTQTGFWSTSVGMSEDQRPEAPYDPGFLTDDVFKLHHSDIS